METLVRGYVPANNRRFDLNWGMRTQLSDAESLGIVVNARAFRRMSNNVGLIYPMLIDDIEPESGSLIQLYLHPRKNQNGLVEVVINSSAVRESLKNQTPEQYTDAINPYIREVFYRSGIKHLLQRSIVGPFSARSTHLIAACSLTSAMFLRSDDRKVDYMVPAYEACVRG